MTAVIDMYATKGTEYILILAYLAILIPFWLILRGGSARRARRAARAVVEWFRIPDEVGFHPGHTWASRVAGNRVRVGVDDLAQAFVGAPEALTLPAIGTALSSGGRGWSLTLQGHEVPMLAPVSGTVVAVNREVLADPSLLADPYGRGWLLEVAVPSRKKALASLLTGESARAWTAATVDALRTHMGGELGPVMQDGGTPIAGFGRQLGPDWPTLCADLFGTTDLVAPAPAAAPPDEERTP